MRLPGVAGEQGLPGLPGVAGEQGLPGVAGKHRLPGVAGKHRIPGVAQGLPGIARSPPKKSEEYVNAEQSQITEIEKRKMLEEASAAMASAAMAPAL